MTDIFAQQGITFEGSGYASTAPSASAPAPQVPKAAPADTSVNDLPVSNAPRGNPNMTQDEKNQAITSLYGNDNEVTPAPQTAKSARDLFAEQGIEAPTVTQSNANAFADGVSLNNQPQGSSNDSWAPVSRSAMSQVDFGEKQLDQKSVQNYAATDDAQIMQLAKTRFSPAQIEQWKNEPITFGEAFQKLHASQVLPGGGIAQLGNSMQITELASKVKNGETLTPDEQSKLNGFLDEQIEQRVRGFSWGGNVAYIGSQIPAFAIEFALSDGVGKTAQTAVRKVAEEAAVHSALTSSIAAASRVATTTALMPGQYLPKYGERRMNDIMAITDKGDLVLKNSEESPATSALLAYAHTSADAAAQIAAPGIGKYVVNPAKKLVSTPLVSAVNNLPTAVKESLYQAYKVIEPNARVSKVLTSAGWAGMIEQLGANRVAEVLHASLDLSSDDKMTMNQYLDRLTPSKDQLMVEGGLLAIAGGVHSSANVAFNLMKSKGISAATATETVNNMSAIEKDNFVTENLPTPVSKYPEANLAATDLATDAAKAVAPQQADVGLPATATYLDVPMTPEQPASVLYDGAAVRSQTDAAQAKEPPPINDNESIFNYLNRLTFNRGAAAEEPYNKAVASGFTPPLMDNTPMLMALNHQTPELVRSHTQVNTFKWDTDGKIINTGKSLKSVLDDYDNYFVVKEPNRETRRAEFEDFLIARHYLSLEETAPHVFVTDEQKAKSKADLTKLGDKYGEDLRMFENFGNEFVDYRNRTRDLLVGTLLTPEQRANERKLFPYSVPLKREMDETQYEQAVAKGNYAGLNPGDLTKRLKGSALPVKNIIHSTLRESARTIDFVMRNRVNESIYNLREFAPDQVQETQLPIVKTGTADFSVAYDPKLRDKLEKTIEFLGGKIERVQSIKGAQRGALGSYSEQEKLVRMRIGSDEGTLTHEVGHLLDHKFDLKGKMLKEPEIKKELQKLAEDRLGAESDLIDTPIEGVRFKEQVGKASKKYRDYIKNDDEIIANFFDAYVNSPEQVDAVAPKAKAAFDALIASDNGLNFIQDIKPSTARQTEKIKKDVFGYGELPSNTLAFWRDGEKKFVKVSKPMFESLSDMRPSQISAAAKFFSATARIASGARTLTVGATSTPEFILRNPVRDTLEASIQSGVGYGPSYIPKTLYGMMTKSQEYKEFVQAGGKFASYMGLGDGVIEKSFSDILNPQSKLRKLITHPIEAYEQLPKASETLTRFGVYRAAIDKGYSPVEAAEYSLNATLNFPRGGSAVKAANQYMPFLNVGFLAAERLVKGFKSDPKTMTLRGVTYLTIPSLTIAGYYLYGADEQTRNEWLELPVDQIAQGRVYFKYNNEWRYIPAPYALGYLFSGLPQMALRQLHENNPDDGRAAWTHLVKGFAGAISPVNDWSSFLPPLLKVSMEDITNYDFYRGRSIYSKFKEGSNVLQEDKTNSYDTETAKALGKIFKISPAVIDHTVYGLFGGSGGYALRASDAGINAVRRAKGENVPEKPQTGADVPVVAAFTSRAPEGTRSNSYQGFQQHYLDAQAIAAHYKNMDSGEGKAEYQRDNSQTLSQLPALKSAGKTIESRLKQIRTITVDEHMSSEQKTERIMTLEKEITRIARNANNQYNAANKAGK